MIEGPINALAGARQSIAIVSRASSCKASRAIKRSSRPAAANREANLRSTRKCLSTRCRPFGIADLHIIDVPRAQICCTAGLLERRGRPRCSYIIDATRLGLDSTRLERSHGRPVRGNMISLRRTRVMHTLIIDHKSLSSNTYSPYAN